MSASSEAVECLELEKGVSQADWGHEKAHSTCE